MRMQVMDELKLLDSVLGNVNEFKEEGPPLPLASLPHVRSNTFLLRFVGFISVEDHQSELDSMKRRNELGLPIVDKRYLSEKANGPSLPSSFASYLRLTFFL